jgi:hypothetical protein
MTRELRKAFGEPRNGLVLANGGVATHEYVVCLSSRPRRDGSPYPERNPLPPKTVDWFVPEIEAVADGDANVEVFPFPVFCLSFDMGRKADEVDLHGGVQSRRHTAAGVCDWEAGGWK